jgi:hypothetical protein
MHFKAYEVDGAACCAPAPPTSRRQALSAKITTSG